jgi:hypothetical protein
MQFDLIVRLQAVWKLLCRGADNRIHQGEAIETSGISEITKGILLCIYNRCRKTWGDPEAFGNSAGFWVGGSESGRIPGGETGEGGTGFRKWVGMGWRQGGTNGEGKRERGKAGRNRGMWAGVGEASLDGKTSRSRGWWSVLSENMIVMAAV